MRYLWSISHPFCVEPLWEQDNEIAYIERCTFAHSNTTMSTIIKSTSDFYQTEWYTPAYIPGTLFLYKKVLCYVYDYQLNNKKELVYICRPVGQENEWIMTKEELALSLIDPKGMFLKPKNHPKQNYYVSGFPESPVSLNSSSIRVYKVTPKKETFFRISFNQLFEAFWMPYMYQGESGIHLFMKESFKKVPPIIPNR